MFIKHAMRSLRTNPRTSTFQTQSNLVSRSLCKPVRPTNTKFAPTQSTSLFNTQTHNNSPLSSSTLRDITQKWNIQFRNFATDKTGEVPTIGARDSVKEGTVIKKWRKSVGDYVKQDELVVSIETDKGDIEFRAPASGVITKALVGLEDEFCRVGTDLFTLDTTAAAPTEFDSAKTSQPPQQQQQQQQMQADTSPSKP